MPRLGRLAAVVVFAVAAVSCTAAGPDATAEPALAGDPVPALDVTGLGPECAALAGELVEIADEFPYRALVDVEAAIEVARIQADAPRVCGEAGMGRFVTQVLGPWSAAIPPTFDPVVPVHFDTSCDDHLSDVRAALSALGDAEPFDADTEAAVADAYNAIPSAVDPADYVTLGEPVPASVADHADDGCTDTELVVFRQREELPLRRLAGIVAYNSSGDVATDGARLTPDTLPTPVEATEAEVFESDACDIELAQLNERVADLSAVGAPRTEVDAAVDALVAAEARCGLRD